MINNIRTYILAAFAGCCVALALTSCNDIVTYDDEAYVAPENQPNTGAPEIIGIYEARDVIYDSPLTEVTPGQRIRIHGKNLNHVERLSFNGFETDVEQVACASDYCVVKVPTDFNVAQTEGLSYTTDMGTTLYDIKVVPAALEVVGLKNEFCAAGQAVSVIGSLFRSYNFGAAVTSITLNCTALTPADVTNEGMTLTIPAGTPDNSLIMMTWTDGEGAQQSAQLYYRPTAMMLFGQTLTGSDTWLLQTDADVNTGAAALGYPHLHLSGEMPQWQWNDVKIEKVIDGLDTLTNRANYQFVFEVLTPKGQPLPSSADGFMDGFMFGMNQPDGNNGCEWEIDGGFDTEGQWQTVRLPLTEVMPFPVYAVPSVHNVIMKIIFQTAVAGNYDVRLANFRLQRIPMTAQLTSEKEVDDSKQPREPVVTLSEEEHVVSGWAGYGIETEAFEQCEEGDIITVYVKDVADGAEVALQERGEWSTINSSDNSRYLSSGDERYSYKLTGEDAYKLKMNGLWVTGGTYTAIKVTLTAVTEE